VFLLKPALTKFFEKNRFLENCGFNMVFHISLTVLLNLQNLVKPMCCDYLLQITNFQKLCVVKQVSIKTEEVNSRKSLIESFK